jgi:uncharacterized protein (TIGR02147 family)
MLNYKDYRDILRQELATRAGRNRSYTQAAFARDIEISRSLLSEILSGRHGLSATRAARIAARLGLSADEAQHFCDLVDREHARSPGRKRAAAEVVAKRQGAVSKITEFGADAMRFIADWYHLGILELTTLDAYVHDERRIAQYLGLTQVQVGVALERLKRLGLITASGRSVRSRFLRTNITAAAPSTAIKEFHRGLIRKAEAALFGQSRERRYASSVIMGVKSADVPRLMERLEALRNEFCDANYESKPHDALYCLAIQFFDLKDSHHKGV